MRTVAQVVGERPAPSKARSLEIAVRNKQRVSPVKPSHSPRCNAPSLQRRVNDQSITSGVYLSGRPSIETTSPGAESSLNSGSRSALNAVNCLDAISFLIAIACAALRVTACHTSKSSEVKFPRLNVTGNIGRLEPEGASETGALFSEFSSSGSRATSTGGRFCVRRARNF